MKSRFAIGMFAVVVLGLGVSARADFTMDDITYWVGEGTNRAALVIDWNDAKSPASLAWGFRWDGAATGYDMLRAVAGSGLIREVNGGADLGAFDGADDRLYARISVDPTWGPSVFGMGYDLDGDGGAFVPGFEGSETGYAADIDDHYAEGWFTGFWGYWGSTDGVNWAYPGNGMADRVLSDGDWDGLSYDAVFSFSDPPSEPVAATVPEPATMVLCIVGGAAMLLRRRRRR